MYCKACLLRRHATWFLLSVTWLGQWPDQERHGDKREPLTVSGEDQCSTPCWIKQLLPQKHTPIQYHTQGLTEPSPHIFKAYLWEKQLLWHKELERIWIKFNISSFIEGTKKDDVHLNASQLGPYFTKSNLSTKSRMFRLSENNNNGEADPNK